MTLEQIATDIADEAECNVIESECPVTVYESVSWYDTRPVRGRNHSWVTRAVAYLNLRGLLLVCYDYPHLVRIPRAAELGLQARTFLCP
jgi:hypothetical protein